ncbi:MAG TPA: nucleotide sugar dehydrogenase [Planctomycetota bacterium]|nr:nucleotide sugar dehydrogenase [Planctomycetota bacterium]
MTSAPDLAASLRERLSSRSAAVGVVGLGFVGLPLAAAFAEAGFRVLGVDADPRRVADLNRGLPPTPDVSPERLARLLAVRRLEVGGDPEVLREADAISICVPTPLRKTREPDLSFVLAASDAVAARARPGQLVVLESTTYPGTTREVLQPRLEARGLRPGVDVFLAFSPERIDPGNRDFGVRNTPKVVAGLTKACASLAAVLYGAIVERVVPVSSLETAETVKLLENTFRAVNSALVNEIALVCRRLGLDVWEVVEAAGTKPFGFLPFRPGPGIGGHCLPTDPQYLSWRMRALDYRVRFIELADEVNRAMPGVVVERVAEALNEDRKSVNGARLLLLGLAYKGGVGDTRESPALDVARGLRERGGALVAHDPFVPAAVFETLGLPRLPALETAELRGFDAAVVTTDHPGVDYARVVSSVPVVVDARNACAGLDGLGRVRRL